MNKLRAGSNSCEDEDDEFIRDFMFLREICLNELNVFDNWLGELIV